MNDLRLPSAPPAHGEPLPGAGESGPGVRPVCTRFVLHNPWYPVPQAASGRAGRKETPGAREHAELKRLALTSPTYWDFDIGGGEGMTLQERINQLVEQHGSLRAVARVTAIDVGYLSRLRAGEKVNPEKEKLHSLGLRRVVTYEPLPENCGTTHCSCIECLKRNPKKEKKT